MLATGHMVHCLCPITSKILSETWHTNANSAINIYIYLCLGITLMTGYQTIAKSCGCGFFVNESIQFTKTRFVMNHLRMRIVNLMLVG